MCLDVDWNKTLELAKRCCAEGREEVTMYKVVTSVRGELQTPFQNDDVVMGATKSLPEHHRRLPWSGISFYATISSGSYHLFLSVLGARDFVVCRNETNHAIVECKVPAEDIVAVGKFWGIDSAAVWAYTPVRKVWTEGGAT